MKQRNDLGGEPLKTPQGVLKDSSPIGNSVIVNSVIGNSSSVTKKKLPGADALERETRNYLMGVCRESGYTELGRCGSILKVLVKRHNVDTLERVIRGLRVVMPDAESLRPVHSKTVGDRVWDRAHEAGWNLEKESPPKKPKAGTWTPSPGDTKPEHISVDLSKYTGEAA